MTHQNETETDAMETRIPCEYEHDFVLVLSGIAELSPHVENALFEAGCDDATISVRSGRVYLTFSRSAASLKDAMLSAILDVIKSGIGAQVLRIDQCNLVTQAEIARKIGRTRSLVHQFINGVRGPGGFPAPECHITERAPLWRWCEVAHWLWQNGMLKENALRAAQYVETLNCVLDFLNQKQQYPEFVKEIFSDLQACNPE
jgi:hypothetical protein